MWKWVGVLAVVAMSLTACQTTGDYVKFPNAVGIGSSVVFDSDKVEVSGLLATPSGKGPFPAIVLLHSSGGMRGAVTDEWPRYFTSIGYVTLTPDSFGSRGYPPGKHRVPNEFKAITTDAYGARDFLAKHPLVDPTKIAVMGSSLGATVINLFSSKKYRKNKKNDFQAGIALYGNCGYLTTLTDPPFPLLQLIGSEDIYSASCRGMPDENPIRVYEFSGVHHAFDESRFISAKYDNWNHKMLYDGYATTKSEEMVKAFLATHLFGQQVEKIWVQEKAKLKPSNERHECAQEPGRIRALNC